MATKKTKNVIRCPWCEGNDVMRKYHDEEWGTPLYDDKRLFEFFVLDAFQAGLTWNIILQKRENFRKAFANFDVKKVAKFGDIEVQKLLANEGIVRNRLKVAATITNAQNFIIVQKEFGSFSKYIWQFTDGKPIVNNWKTQKEFPASTAQSDAMSKDLKKRGFKFCGTTICYAFMQAAGMVNDHLADCSFKKR
jgi:DNA-3-methyladenine glycosylase I